MTEESIVALVLQQPEVARGAFLDAACGGDVALRARVEALLRARERKERQREETTGERTAAEGSGRRPDRLDATMGLTIQGHQPGGQPAPSPSLTESGLTDAPGERRDATEDLTALPLQERAARSPDDTSATVGLPRDRRGGPASEGVAGVDGKDVLAFLGPPRETGSLGRLDHFEVLEIVGQGGMGVVLRALDTRLRRINAIKVLAPQLAASATARKRFAREARAAAAVRDDHVVGIHGVRENGPVPYLVMEFVAGLTLDERVKREGALPLNEVVRIGMQTARGLAAAHAQGLIHRDVKPGNVLLEGGLGRVKITDFGLARAADDASVTQSGVIAGTPLYMSPEQARGEAVDHRSDLFSLGSVLYTLCTGHPAFRAATTIAVLTRVCEDTPRPIRESNPKVPQWLCAFIDKLLAKAPADRIQTAAEVADLLGRFLAHLEQPDAVAPPPIAGVGAWALRRRRKRVLLAAGTFLVALAVALGGYLAWRPGSDTPPPPEVGGGQEQAKGWRPRTEAELAVLSSPLDGRTREQIAPGLLALAGSSDPGRAPQELVAAFGLATISLPDNGTGGYPSVSPDGKVLAVPNGPHVRLFDVKSGQLLRSFRSSTTHVYHATFSPDGKKLAVTSGWLPEIAKESSALLVTVHDVETGKQLLVLRGHTRRAVWAAFDADGKRLATASKDGTVRVWDAKTGAPLQTLTAPEGGLISVVFSPDGKQVVGGMEDGKDLSVLVWGLGDGKVIHRLNEKLGWEVRVGFSPDGKFLAAGGQAGWALWDARTVRRVHRVATRVSFLDFSPDGKSLWAGGGERMTCWDTASAKELPGLPIDGQYAGLCFSPDGKALFVHRHGPPVGEVHREAEPFVRVYDVSTAPGERRGHIGPVWAVAVSPDGRTIASGGADATVRLWDLAGWKAGEPQPPARVLTGQLAGHSATVYSVAFSPDCKLIASASLDGTIRLWNAATGQAVRSLARESKGTASEVAFSADGKTLATGEEDGSVRLWDVASGEEQSPLRWHNRRVGSVAFSPDGRFLASAGALDRKVQLTDLRTFLNVQTLGPGGDGGPEMKLAFGGDGRTLAYAGWDTNVRLWDVVEKKETVLTGGGPKLDGLAMGPTGRFVAVARGGAVRLWDRNAPKQSLVIGPGPFGVTAQHIAFTPEGRYIVVAGHNGAISILRTPAPPPPYSPGPPRKLPGATELAKRPSAADGLKHEAIAASLLKLAGDGDPLRVSPEVVAILGDARFRLPQAGQNSWMAMDREGKFLAVPNADVVALFDAKTGELVRTLTGHTDRVYAVAFSPDGKSLAGGNWAGEKKTSTVKVWDLKTGEVTLSVDGGVDNFHGIGFSRDGKRLFASGPGGVQVWDRTGKLVRTFEASGKVRGPSLYHIALSADGKRVVCNDTPTAVKVWEIEGDSPPVALTGHTSWPLDAAYSPDGKWLATGSDKELLLWDAETLKLVKKIDTPAGWLAFAPDKKTLLTAQHHWSRPLGNDVVTRWDLTTYQGKPLPPLSARDGWPVYHLSPDGKTLYSLVADGPETERRVRVYDAATGKQALSSNGHTGQAKAVAASPDGKRLASAGEDGTVRVWDLASRKPLHTITRAGQADAVAFSPDGKTVAAHWDKGPVVLFDAASGAEVRTLTGAFSVYPGRQMPFSPDGTLLAAGSFDGLVRVWDVSSVSIRRTFSGGTGQALAPAFSPDGKVLAAATDNGDVALWDLASGWQVGALPRQRGPVMWLGFHPDGRSVATSGHWAGDALGPDSTRYAFTPTAGANKGKAGRFASRTYERHLEAGQQYKFVMTALDEKLVPLLVVDEAGDGKQLRSAHATTDGGLARAEVILKPAKATTCKVIACAESGDGWFELKVQRGDGPAEFVSGTGYVPVHDLATGKVIYRLAGHDGGINSGAWRADGQRLVTAGDDGALRAWDLGVTPPMARLLQGLPLGRLNGVALTPEGRYAAAGSAAGDVVVVRIPDLPAPYDPGPARKVPTPAELAKRPSVADALKRENVPAGLLKLVGGGDPARVPPVVVAILGDARFRLPKAGLSSWMALDRQGKWLAVPNADGVVIFDAKTGELVRTLTGHSGRVYAVAFSPDGTSLAGGNWPGNRADQMGATSIKVWDLKTGDVTATLNGHTAPVFSVAFSPDGKRLASAAADGVKLWDVKTGGALRTLEVKVSWFWQLAFSPDGKRIVCGDHPSNTARVFDADTGELLATLKEHPGGARAAAYSPDGKQLATGSETELILWDAEKWELVKKIDTPAGWLAFGPGGKSLLTAKHDHNGEGRNHVVTRWDLETVAGKPLPSLSDRAGWTVYQLAPDGKTLYSMVAAQGAEGHGERRVRAYDAATGKELFPPQGHTEHVRAVAFSPDGKRVASVSGDPGVRLWDVATGKPERVLPNESDTWSVAFSPDGKYLAAGEGWGTVVLYDAATGEKLRTLAGQRSHVRAVAFSPDGRLVAGTTTIGIVHVWEAATGRLRHTLLGPREANVWGWGVAFSPDSKTLATAWDLGQVRLYDMATGWEVANLRVSSGEVRWLGFHPDGRTLGTVGNNRRPGDFFDVGNEIHFGTWDLKTRKPVRRMVVPASSHGHVGGAWRPDGLVMASCEASEGTVHLWSTDGQPDRHQVIRLYPPKTEWLHGLAMSPEGRHLATANPDGIVSILRIAGPPPAYDPGPARPVVTAKDLATRPAAADGLKRENIPATLLKQAGGGDTGRVPPEVVAILGDARFRLPKVGQNSWMAMDRQGKYLAVPNSDVVAVFDAKTGERLHTLTGTGRMYSVAFSPDGKSLATGNWEGDWGDKERSSTIKVWRLDTGEVTTTLTSGVGWMWALTFTPDGKRLIGSGNTGVEVWDLETAKAVHTFAGTHQWQMGVSPDGKKVASCDADGKKVRAYDTETGTELGTLEGFADVVRCTVFSADGKWLATGNDRELLLWDAEKLQLVKKFDTPGGWVAFEPGGKTMLTARHDQNGPNRNHVVTRWDLKTFEGKPLPSLSNRAAWAMFQLSPDGKALYSLLAHGPVGPDYELRVRVYDAATGKELFPAQGHDSQVWAVAFSPDGKRLASVSSEPGVRLWDAATGKAVRVLANEQGFYSVAFSADGKRIAAGENEGTVVLYDAITGEKLRTLAGQKSRVQAVAFSPDGTLVAGTTCTGVVNVWDVATGRLRHALVGQRTLAWCLAFSPDGKTLATGWEWGEVRLYDVVTGWEVANLRVGIGNFWVRWLAFHPDGRSLAIAGKGAVQVQSLSVWDLATRKEARRMPVSAVRGGDPGRPENTDYMTWFGHLGGAMRADGLLLATCDARDGSVRLWSTAGKPEREQVIRLYPPNTIWLHGLAMSPEGRHLATANPDGTVTVLRLAKRGEVFMPRAPRLLKSLAGHTGKITSVAYSPDGKLLASGGLTDVRVWDAMTGKLKYSLPVRGQGTNFLALTFSPDSRFLLTAPHDLPKGETKNPIRIWDAQTGQPAGTLEGHTKAILQISFSPDGKTLVSAGHDTAIRVWDFAKRAEVRAIASPDGNWLRAALVSSSGQLAVGGRDIHLLDLEGELLRTIPWETNPPVLALSPDGQRLAAMHYTKGTAHLWDTKTGKEVRSWLAHDGRNNGVAFSRDGRVLVTPGSDGAVRLWDVATGCQLAELPHDGEAYAVAFSPDGKTLATTGIDDKLVKIWDVSDVLRSHMAPK